MQVANWQRDVLTHASVLVYDAKDSSVRRMVADHDRVGMVIWSAKTVDLAYHPLTPPCLVVTLCDSTNKLVSKNTVVPGHISLNDF